MIFIAAILQNTCWGSKYKGLSKNKPVFYISALRSFPIEKVSFHLSLQNSLVQKTLHIQGDSGGICETSGNDSMCDSKQKSSYEHGSDFERLWSYDCLKLRIEGNDY